MWEEIQQMGAEIGSEQSRNELLFLTERGTDHRNSLVCWILHLSQARNQAQVLSWESHCIPNGITDLMRKLLGGETLLADYAADLMSLV